MRMVAFSSLMPLTVHIELVTPDELARCFRTFTPESRQPNVCASAFVRDGELIIDTEDEQLAAFIRAAIADVSGPSGALQLPGYHTSTQVNGGTLNKHFPGDWVSPTDPRYPEALTRMLCFVGEHEASRR